MIVVTIRLISIFHNSLIQYKWMLWLSYVSTWLKMLSVMLWPMTFKKIMFLQRSLFSFLHKPQRKGGVKLWLFFLFLKYLITRKVFFFCILHIIFLATLRSIMHYIYMYKHRHIVKTKSIWKDILYYHIVIYYIMIK